MTSLSIRFRRAGFTPSALFSNQPEDSRRLRSLTLATLLWSAAALIWVGGLPWVCLAAAGVATIGHWASAGRKLPQRAVAVGTIAAFIVLTILMWQDLVNAITGDRLPAAYYLLMLQSISAFILRTRGGLYGHIGLSGLVLYFVSERSFTSEFAIFLIVFSGLFLTFFAIAHMEDELRTSNIHWSEGQWGRLLLWLGVVAFGLLVASALAFALLPPDYRGGSGAQRTGTLPFLGSNDQTQFNEAQAFLQGQNPVAPGQELQVTEDPAGDGSGPSLPSEFDTEESGNLG
ncbi:MAG: hypothetical protein FJ317_08455, partial [SAR202 cluster bacterium]|nr:hypothetical protein [SAR202 cluster bacterium]